MCPSCELIVPKKSSLKTSNLTTLNKLFSICMAIGLGVAEQYVETRDLCGKVLPNNVSRR